MGGLPGRVRFRCFSLAPIESDETQATLREDPYNLDFLSVYLYAPGHLDLIEEWLRGLRR